MTQRIELPNGEVAEFPDNLPDAKITEVIANTYPEFSAKPKEHTMFQKAQATLRNSFAPQPNPANISEGKIHTATESPYSPPPAGQRPVQIPLPVQQPDINFGSDGIENIHTRATTRAVMAQLPQPPTDTMTQFSQQLGAAPEAPIPTQARANELSPYGSAENVIVRETSVPTNYNAQPNVFGPQRYAQDFAAGELGSTASLFDYLGAKTGIKSLSGIGQSMGGYAQDITPRDQAFADKLASGIGSFASFYIPGLGVAKATGVLSALPLIAQQGFGAGTMAALESAMEAGDVYDTLRKTRPDISEQEAQSRADKVFWENLPFIAVTDKIGFFNNTVGPVAKALLAAGTNAAQEAGQSAISNIATDRPITEGMGESALIGGIIGGGVGAVQGVAERPQFNRSELAAVIQGEQNGTANANTSNVPETNAQVNAQRVVDRESTVANPVSGSGPTQYTGGERSGNEGVLENQPSTGLVDSGTIQTQQPEQDTITDRRHTLIEPFAKRIPYEDLAVAYGTTVDRSGQQAIEAAKELPKSVEEMDKAFDRKIEEQAVEHAHNLQKVNIEEIRNAIQKSSTGEVFQRAPEGTRSSRSQRQRVEPSVRGQEVAQAQAAPEGAASSQQVSGIEPHVRTLLTRLTPAQSTLGRKANLRPAIERAKQLMRGERAMTQTELGWWNRQAASLEKVDTPAAEAAHAIAAIVKSNKAVPTVAEVQFSKRAAEPSVHVDTPEFKNWFGKSQVVDRGGNPKLMYHGTAFPIESGRMRPGVADAIFLTPDPKLASDFAAYSSAEKRQSGKNEGGENVLPVYVSAQRPFDYTRKEDLDGLRKAVGETFGGDAYANTIADVARGSWMALENPVVQRYIRTNGYDGFYTQEAGVKNLAVFDSKQIKSAIGNAGAFNPNRASILESVQPATMSAEEPEFAKQRAHQTSKDEILAEVKKQQPGWVSYINKLLSRGEKGERGGLVIATQAENEQRIAELLAKKNNIPVAEAAYSIRSESEQRNVSPYRKSFPNVRGGWTKNKILKVLKISTGGSSGRVIHREIAKFDNAEEFGKNIFYHGTGGSVTGALKPSITMSQREADRVGGGGSGQRYWTISVSKNKNKAQLFTGQSRYGTVYPIILKKGATVISLPELSNSSELEDMIEDLWDRGIDAVRLGNWDDAYSEQELAVLNPHAIFKYNVGQSFRVFGGEKLPVLSKSQIEDLYRKAVDEIPHLDAIRNIPSTDERSRALLEDLPELQFTVQPLNTVGNVSVGVYVPALGISFINSDKISAKESPSIILHEMTHEASDEKMLSLGEEVIRRLQTNSGVPIYNKVLDRMQRVGEENNPREALNYLVEETLLEAKRAGYSRLDSGFFAWVQKLHFSIPKIIKQWVARIRAILYEHGKITPEHMAIDDMIAVAESGMKKVATGEREAAGKAGTKPTVNIGLEKNDKSGFITTKEVRSEIEKLGVKILSENVHQSGTEPTFVGELSRPLTEKEIYTLSEKLHQEAIAQRYEDGTGILAGPQAENWGKYNPEYFLMPNGKHASETVPTEVQLSKKVITGDTERVRTPKPAEVQLSVKSTASNTKAKFNTLKTDTLEQLDFDYVNEFTDLVKLQKRIGPVPENQNAANAQQLYSGRVGARVTDFHDDMLVPLLEKIQKSGLTFEQVEDYLKARHAPSRNAAMKEINPTQSELDAERAILESELTRLGNTAKVQEYLRVAKELNGYKFDAIHGQADATAVKTLQSQLSKLEQEKDVDDFTTAFVRAKALASAKPFVGDNTSLSGMSDKEAAEIIAKAKQDGTERALAAIAKDVYDITSKTRENLVKGGLMKPEEAKIWENKYVDYVPLHRDEITNSSQPALGKGFNIKGKESKQALGSQKEATNVLAHVFAQYEASIIRSEKDRVDLAMFRLMAAHPDKNLVELDSPDIKRALDASTGIVVSRVDPLYKNKDNVLVFKVNGEEHTITFNEDNPVAMRLAFAFKNMGARELKGATKIAGMYTRFVATMSTSANPVFVLRNFLRDIQTAFVNLSDTPLADKKAQVFKSIVPAMRGFYKMSKGDTSSQWAKYAREFRDAGGQVGWLEGYKDIFDRAQHYKDMVDRMGPGAMKASSRAMREWWGLIEDANNAVENSVRLAAYVAARKAGMSEGEAALLAKNLTVNFNIRGAKSVEMNLWYMFSKASINGTSRMIQASKSKKVRRILGGIVLSGFLLDMLARSMAGDEDDDGENDYDQLPEYVKANNWVFWGNGKPYTIPMPYGYNFFASLGRKVGELAFKEGYGATDAAKDLSGIMLNAFSPLGNAGSFLQTISPTITDPFVQLAENKNFAGNPIYKEQLPFATPKPDYQMGFKSASKISNAIAKFLNNNSGGNEERPGTISLNPSVLDFAVQSIFGGAGKTYLQTVSLPLKLAGDEEVKPKEIPFVSIFAGSKPENQAEGKFYANVKTIGIVAEELKNPDVDREKLMRDHGEEVNLVGYSKRVQQRISKLNFRIRAIEAMNAPDKTVLKELQDTKTKLMNDFNKAVFEAARKQRGKDANPSAS